MIETFLDQIWIFGSWSIWQDSWPRSTSFLTYSQSLTWYRFVEIYQLAMDWPCHWSMTPTHEHLVTDCIAEWSLPASSCALHLCPSDHYICWENIISTIINPYNTVSSFLIRVKYIFFSRTQYENMARTLPFDCQLSTIRPQYFSTGSLIFDRKINNDNSPDKTKTHLSSKACCLWPTESTSGACWRSSCEALCESIVLTYAAGTKPCLSFVSTFHQSYN